MTIIYIIIIIIIILIILIPYNLNERFNMNKKEDETNCIYMSSRGLLKSCDIFSKKPVSSIRELKDYDFSNAFENCLIYICTSAIPDFIKYLDKINVRFILVTGDADESCPTDILSNDDFIKFIENNKIIKWYAQNCVIEHPKLSKIPIGLDYHSNIGNLNMSPIKNEQMMIDIKNISKPFYEREIKCYINFLFGFKFNEIKYGYDRQDAINQIPKELIYYEPTRVTRDISFKNQIKYAFVVSPHGNGLDCHRTWEALCIGCIPIVKTSSIDSLYDELPVLIVKDWSDVNIKLLTDTINEFKNKKFNYDKLLLKYWIDKIKSFK